MMVHGYGQYDTTITVTKQLNSSHKIFLKKLNATTQAFLDKDTLNFNLTKLNDSIERFALINNSSNPIELVWQDRSLICIKEAKRKKTKWLPIEYWLYSWCGNSYSNKVVNPGQVLVFMTRKQYGNKKVQIRLRLKSTNGVILSDPYDVFIED
jgi:hypothetical protein